LRDSTGISDNWPGLHCACTAPAFTIHVVLHKVKRYCLQELISSKARARRQTLPKP